MLAYDKKNVATDREYSARSIYCCFFGETLRPPVWKRRGSYQPPAGPLHAKWPVGGRVKLSCWLSLPCLTAAGSQFYRGKGSAGFRLQFCQGGVHNGHIDSHHSSTQSPPLRESMTHHRRTKGQLGRSRTVPVALSSSHSRSSARVGGHRITRGHRSEPTAHKVEVDHGSNISKHLKSYHPVRIIPRVQSYHVVTKRTTGRTVPPRTSGIHGPGRLPADRRAPLFG